MSTNSRDRRHKTISPRQCCSCSSTFLIFFGIGSLGLMSIIRHEYHLSVFASRTIFDWSTRNVIPQNFIRNQRPYTVKPTKARHDGVEVPRTKLTDSFSFMQPYNQGNKSTDLHFIHIPKCGGTSMTAILREVACKANPVENVDCCTNPGSTRSLYFRRQKS